MTAILAAEPVHRTDLNAARRTSPRRPERAADSPPRKRRTTVAALKRSPGRTGGRTGEACLPASPPGAIGGAVIQAARRSAGLTRRRLARMLAVTSRTVRNWENGRCPLFCAGYGQLCRLAAALEKAGATAGRDAGELILAARCDLLVTGMLQGFEDYAEVPPADEAGAEGDAARGLLRWALAGAAPGRYRPYAPAGPLLAAQDVIAFTALARDLNAGSHGDQLIGYGAALTALTAS